MGSLRSGARFARSQSRGLQPTGPNRYGLFLLPRCKSRIGVA